MSDDVLCHAAHEPTFEPGAAVGPEHDDICAPIRRLLDDLGAWVAAADTRLDLQTGGLECCGRSGERPFRFGLGHFLELGDRGGAHALDADGQIRAGGHAQHSYRARLWPGP
jgi:hypothetical protein